MIPPAMLPFDPSAPDPRLVDRCRYQLGFPNQACVDLWPINQCVQHVPEQIRGRFIASNKQQHVETNDILIGKMGAIDLGVDDRAHQISTWTRSTFTNERVEIRGHLGNVQLPRFRRGIGDGRGERV